MIYWFIGQPGCGKTTLARRLKVHFDKNNVPSIHLDGDDLRVIFGNAYSKEHFTLEWRTEQTRSLQKFVAYLADQGVHVIVSTVNPYKAVREEFKSTRPDLKEIYVVTDDVRGREDKWAKDFESPETNYVLIKTGSGRNVEETFHTLRSHI